jgi:hypothetical protein
MLYIQIRKKILVITSLIIFLFLSVTSGAQQNTARTNRYIFLPKQSKLVQTGGIAGVNRTYTVQGQFALTIDSKAGTAFFTLVDANALDDSQHQRTLDPNEVFAMTGLDGTVLNDTTLVFTGLAADGSKVNITATLQDDIVLLAAETVPPPDSADFFIFTMNAAAQRKYAGGTGEPNNPYQITTTTELIALANEPNDYDKCFIMTNNIDLSPNLPGGKVFDNAVIAPDTDQTWPTFEGTPFVGVFDGNGHTISHLTITGKENLGLFGQLGWESAPAGEIKNLGVVDVNITGTHQKIGGLVGYNTKGTLSKCYSTGIVSSTGLYPSVGGLIGRNFQGSLIQCYSTCTVSGYSYVGGLVGMNYEGTLIQCYSTGAVSCKAFGAGGLVGRTFKGTMIQCYNTGTVKGITWLGGLLGYNDFGTVAQCYSTCDVDGSNSVGGLVGYNWLGNVTECYSTGTVVGNDSVGGLVGYNIMPAYVNSSFWDMQTSGQVTSAGGTGKTTVEMKTKSTFTDAGWDFIGETINSPNDIWWILDQRDYPRLWWQLPDDDFADGVAEPLWFVYAIDPELAWLDEINGRLQVYTAGQMEDVDAFYVNDGWQLDANEPFAMRINFHFSTIGQGDGRVLLGLVPTIEAPVMQWAQFEVGIFDDFPFYLYEVSNFEWVDEQVSGRFVNDGILYMSYDPNLDELYLSEIGYGKKKAMWSIKGLIRGRWHAESLYITIGGGSEDGIILNGNDSWLDNFFIDEGKILQLQPPLF